MCVCVYIYIYIYIYIYNGILLSHEKNKIPFSTTWMYLEIIILSEVNQREKDKYHIVITCMWNLKNEIEELIYKAETNSQT